MPVALSYPGVYVEEVPSGVRTISGVATSITAFVGWAAKGPTDRAELILSWADYERKFGGLDARSLLGYAVSQFYANGGQRAYIVRLVTTGSTAATDNAGAAHPILPYLMWPSLSPLSLGVGRVPYHHRPARCR